MSFPPQNLSCFSHTKLSFSLLYLSYKIFVVRVFVVIKVLRSLSVHLVFEEANLRVRVCDEFLWELGVKVQPRQASVLACVILARTSEGLAGPEF